MLAIVEQNPILAAFIWMALANLAAFGPGGFKVAALVLMLVSGGIIIPAVFREAGFVLGLPIVLLMLIQLRWTVFFVQRLIREFRGQSRSTGT